MNEPQTTPVDPRVHLQDALEHLRAALAVTPATILAAREIEEAIDHAELAISDLDDGGTAEDVDDEDDGPRPCADCGGFGHGPDTMQGDQHHNGPCPTCNGSGLATPFEDCGPGARRVTGRESASQEAWDRQAELLDGADLPDGAEGVAVEVSDGR